ncbi:hypothetical protein BHF71_07015 [Vulcanibacillus modesticaldus]|uniref:histidine kinase n=1 Tax=Vulcanibacillus modesticaldus TaxID=337097 RepID=A0A1D2YW32_9BACI|nr:HAMP domain-containing sensor histidine kinase [Vulcanibacillus modesticaldus]OEF99940.1 hypothetical protein BHF71_07015 [Vulcanibacillus modesticaldus]
MVIKLKIKMKIGSKIFVTYMLLLVITFLVAFGSFRFLSYKYLIAETREQLLKGGKLISELYKTAPLVDTGIRSQIYNKRRIEVANRIIDAHIIIMNRDKKIIYSTVKIDNYNEILDLSNKLNNHREYVSVRTPIYEKNHNIKGYVVLFAKVREIKRLNNLMFITQLFSFIIAAVIALIIGYLLKNSLTRPLKLLTEKTKYFSLKKFDSDLEINTGDEIEELATSFNQMARRLKYYDERQKRFLQNISHELKTPLMAIQGNAEAIKDGIVQGIEVDNSLEIIIAESQRLKKLVDEIIYLTKIENVNDTFNFNERNLNEIILTAVRSVKNLADQKAITIEIKSNLDIIGNYDKEKLIRAFINILGNGIRYAKSLILIESSIVDDKIEIKIIDDGNGFKDGEEKKIFERFYKGENGGTGIGLAISKAIIEAHKGSIEAYNNTPNGAIFKITLPIYPNKSNNPKV